MKRYLSVFEMIARSSIYKVLLIICTMLAAQAVCFYLSMTSPSGLSIEAYVDQSQYSMLFKIAYILVSIAIVFPGMNLGSVQSYTLQRLRIKEKRIYWLQAVYNFLAYMLLWGAQLVMLFANILVYQKYLPEGAIVTNQTFVMAFYRNDFMHTILPLEDGPGWWVLVLFGVASALAAAETTKLQREGKFGFELVLVIAAAMISFPRALGYDVAFPLIALAVVFCIMGTRWLIGTAGNGGGES